MHFDEFDDAHYEVLVRRSRQVCYTADTNSQRQIWRSRRRGSTVLFHIYIMDMVFSCDGTLYRSTELALV